ncbi:transcriptional regulator, TetR family [Clostridium pasteurianum DSM 525 = ATCC 6013]|uniref:Transcriptional regulator, TetR family n=1 Tax=Clostridium pasteurianum DSM 525 = ATCC 6013 TaxID=1262449 RepID=A0A0H3J6E4_CLOPA|nr:TetR/AcrR family transcriptional regulator [Clostridium pasteurianum]AJA46520.1 transcriptional regulator, TetR family [Clostridium pasteurianum DSM 525 = ATCC 6013]AJA50508.1 transcriptional regulator, TetR family [Clostridium pasteurianum DSM 525 = ATCC 6013]AOZ73945.1 TetR family transcriptional regulator [Clostridium pasteurianum DSM 525 = ATCC 6013]AOZ77742.1 TetR family transcriptional regulator [Clostridium pasteurianum]ELP61093.1 TetR family transcriptional regulator [Clostridium pa
MDKSDNTKNQLIEAVIGLLQECNDVSEITSRKITERAKINLSTINYHFASKDELINIAVNKLIGDAADAYFQDMKNNMKSPKDKLRDFLVGISDIAVDYKKYIREMIPYILLKGEFTQTIEILPLVKECFQESKNDEECKIISYQLISFMQLVFYRADEFKSFSKIDIMNKQERDRLVDIQLDLFIK